MAGMDDGAALKAATYFMVIMLGMELKDSFKDTSRLRRIVSGIRRRHAKNALKSIVVVLVLSGLLSYMLPPALQWSWLQLLGAKAGAGMSTGAAAGSKFDSGHLHILRYVIFLMLVFAMPTLVHFEEKLFRGGSQHRGMARNILACLLFGLTHMLIGVPFHIALALAVVGWIFMGSYMKAYAHHLDADAALMESTRVHLTYNYLLMGLLFLAMLVVDIGKLFV